MESNFQYRYFREPFEDEKIDNYFYELAKHIQNEAKRCLSEYRVYLFDNIELKQYGSNPEPIETPTKRPHEE